MREIPMPPETVLATVQAITSNEGALKAKACFEAWVADEKVGAFSDRKEMIIQAALKGWEGALSYALLVSPELAHDVDPNWSVANEAFEQWASGAGMDMQQHPMFWLFLNEDTYAARQGWKSGLSHYQRELQAAAQV
jgi:hypothetical protein